MNVLIVYCHPNPKSFNHALLEAAREGLEEAGHAVKTRDLYAEPFKVALDAADFQQIMSGHVPSDIKREQELVSWAEGLAFIYPIWWFGPPAALKGWIDRVFLHGFAFEVTAGGAKGLLKHKKALVLNTTGGPEANYDATNAKDMIIRPMSDGTLRFCGITEVQTKTYYGVTAVDDAARKEMLREARALAKQF